MMRLHNSTIGSLDETLKIVTKFGQISFQWEKSSCNMSEFHTSPRPSYWPSLLPSNEQKFVSLLLIFRKFHLAMSSILQLTHIDGSIPSWETVLCCISVGLIKGVLCEPPSAKNTNSVILGPLTQHGLLKTVISFLCRYLNNLWHGTILLSPRMYLLLPCNA